MLSVAQAAVQLDVTPTRVRALIKDGRLAATKIGREWAIREEDVLQRIATRPRAGRPRTSAVETADGIHLDEVEAERMQSAHEAYATCRQIFRARPSSAMMREASSREEASFYMAVSDFFLQQDQARLVAEGIF